MNYCTASDQRAAPEYTMACDDDDDDARLFACVATRVRISSLSALNQHAAKVRTTRRRMLSSSSRMRAIKWTAISA